VKVTVRLFAYLSSVAGTSELVVELDEGSGPMAVVQELSDKFGHRFVDALYAAEDGPVNPFASVIVDGRAVMLTPRADVDLHDGSVVAFLPPLGGG